MSETQPTLGQAIDLIIRALGSLDDVARRTALAAACMQLNISIGEFHVAATTVTVGGDARSRSEESSPAAEGAVVKPRSQEKGVDIRTFKEQKKPSSARQMACVVGFYVQELAPSTDRKETINTQDLEKYFKQAGFKLPGKINQVLADAKLAGYFDAPSRGEYKLNAVGYNLVAHSLPGGGD